jgi:hypothetical protein
VPHCAVVFSSLEALRRHEESHSGLADWEPPLRSDNDSDYDEEDVPEKDDSGSSSDDGHAALSGKGSVTGRGKSEVPPKRKRRRADSGAEERSAFPCLESGCGRQFLQVSRSSTPDMCPSCVHFSIMTWHTLRYFSVFNCCVLLSAPQLDVSHASSALDVQALPLPGALLRQVFRLQARTCQSPAECAWSGTGRVGKCAASGPK